MKTPDSPRLKPLTAETAAEEILLEKVKTGEIAKASRHCSGYIKVVSKDD